MPIYTKKPKIINKELQNNLQKMQLDTNNFVFFTLFWSPF
jgi:hypothetical protein